MRPYLTLLLLCLAVGCQPDDSKLPGDTGPISTDGDGDGYVAGEDCDDGDAAVYPGAAERCDGVDNDCDGAVDEDDAVDMSGWYLDADGDGFGDASSLTEACEAPADHVGEAGDCDDGEATVHPGAAERCNGVDDDCDGAVDEDPTDTWYADADHDGYGDPDTMLADCDPGAGWVADASDCDDRDGLVFPGAEERCNGLDDDCDGDLDEGLEETWYADEDGDGYGDPDASTEHCDPGSGWVQESSDCDDSDASIHPSAMEYCDGVDNDCDGLVDDDDPDIADQLSWYPDADSDGYGLDSGVLQACEQPSGHAALGGDCDDGDPAFNPGASETDCTDPNDYNCDGSTGYTDADGDGWAACEECDDAAAAVHPGATESCNGVDDDCDSDVDEDDAADASTWYGDVDGDGYGDASSTTVACEAPSGFVGDDSDCDDSEATVHPGATESCNGVDDDCDRDVDEDDAVDAPTWYADVDGDGYGDVVSTTRACSQPSGHVADASDCDDADALIHPGGLELCNGVDDDCDGVVDEDDAADAPTWYADVDGDGYGDAGSTSRACSQPSGSTADATDCDDGEVAINPGVRERCNGVDDDCDGVVDEDDAADTLTWYADGDGDGYGDAGSSRAACSQPSGHVADDSDCDDASSTVNPAATELCNGVDDDCDGVVDEDDAADASTWYADSDGDGYGDAASATLACSQPSGHVADDSDCDDGDSGVHPYATEYCDGVDEDCDGAVDEGAADAPTWYLDGDLDGYGDAGSSTRDCSEPSGYTDDDSDCHDGDPDINPGASESCDGVDEDCDGLVDEGLATTTWYYDDDGDGYGDPADSEDACSAPSGAVATAGDCDDLDASIHPGATESCDGVDEDCDGDVDEGFTSGCDSLACSGSGHIATISDGCMHDGGGSSGGDALYIFCIDSIARFCLSGESCKFNPTPSSDDGTTCDRSGLGSDYMAEAWCQQWNGHYYYYCDSSGQIYFP
jgi:hypothetical protein